MENDPVGKKPPTNVPRSNPPRPALTDSRPTAAAEWLCLALETSSARGSIALGRGSGARTGAASIVLQHRTLTQDRRHAAELIPAIQEMLAAENVRPADINLVAFSHGPGSFTGLRIAATIARMWQSATGAQVVAVSTLEVIARNALREGVRSELRVSDVNPLAPLDAVDRKIGPDPSSIAVMLDARRDQVFGALFDRVPPSSELRKPAPSSTPALPSSPVPSPTDPPAPHSTSPAESDLRIAVPPGLHPAESWIQQLPRTCVVLGDAVPKYRAQLEAAGLQILSEDTWLPDAREVLHLGFRRAAAGEFCRPDEIVPQYLRPPECEEVYEQRRSAAKERRQ